MDDSKFLPFYDRLTPRFAGNIVGKILVSALLGLAFLTVHYLIIGNKVFEDWSWFLSALISTTMLCLYYATHTLRIIFPEMDMRLGVAGDEIYMNPLKRILSDRNFIRAGLSFGLLNCVFGYLFGLPYVEVHAVLTILCGYFLAGFVCGMAAFGIYGVSVSISAFAKKAKASFDFTSPDRCGGTLFLGDALVVFGSVTLTVGVMISVYILKTDWTGGTKWWIASLQCFWIAFPYVMSFIALFAPAVPLNKALREYKMEQEVALRDQLTQIRKHLGETQPDATQGKDWRERYEFQQGIRKDLHTMRTWPYDLSTKLNYLVVLVPNLSASVHSALTWIDKHGGSLGV